jgi:hypothetical protein
MAKKKLPKDIRKKVEEWKFTSGALVMCLVAYHDGKDVQALQFVNVFPIAPFYSPDFQHRELSCGRKYVYQFL